MPCVSPARQLDVTYSVNSIGMKYERMLFGMKISDANCLAKAIQANETLASLVLQVRNRGAGGGSAFFRYFRSCFGMCQVFVLLSSPRQLIDTGKERLDLCVAPFNPRWSHPRFRQNLLRWCFVVLVGARAT